MQCKACLHIAQLMLLPLIVSCFSKIQIGFTFLVPAHPGSPGIRAVKRVCACLCLCVCKQHIIFPCGLVLTHYEHFTTWQTAIARSSYQSTVENNIHIIYQLLTKLWKLSEKYFDGNVGGGCKQQNTAELVNSDAHTLNIDTSNMTSWGTAHMIQYETLF